MKSNKAMKNKALEIIERLQDYDYEAYFVGGCVRDMLLGKEVKDYDLTTNATPEQIQEVFGKEVTVCGNNFLVSLVDNIEVATYRLDKGDKAVHADSLEEDVIRRDFTVNGLAMTKTGTLIDFVGGIKDAKNNVLRFIGNPEKRIIEDPARILRGLRFMAKYRMVPDYETHFALLKYRSLVHTLPAERIRDEIIKAFKYNAYEFVKLLDEYELLSTVFPAVYALKGIDGGIHHKETVYTHCLNALKAIDFPHIPLEVKLTALFHDVGKANYQFNEYGNIVFYSHEEHSEVLARENLLALKFPNDVVHTVSKLCLLHMFPILDVNNPLGNTISEKRVKKLLVIAEELGISIKDFLRVRYADKKSNMQKIKVTFSDIKVLYHQILKLINTKPPFSVRDLAVNGYDMMELGLKGPEIGRMLNRLLDLVIENEIINDRETLIDFAGHNKEF